MAAPPGDRHAAASTTPKTQTLVRPLRRIPPRYHLFSATSSAASNLILPAASTLHRCTHLPAAGIRPHSRTPSPNSSSAAPRPSVLRAPRHHACILALAAAMTFRLPNNLVGLLNFVTFLLSIPILNGGIWLAHRGSTDCEKFFCFPVIAIGVFLMVVPLTGLAGACCRVNWLLWVYICVMFLLIVLLFCFTIFTFVVTNKGAGEVVSGRGYKEYRLGDYNHWLQKRVDSGKNWGKIRRGV